jgi:hypothetical protein
MIGLMAEYTLLLNVVYLEEDERLGENKLI